MKVLGVIPARLGSKGVPSKNVRELGEKLVIEYTILDALAAKQLDMVAVTSDDPRVQEICEKYKEVCFISRPVALAGNTARIDDVMRHCCVEVNKQQGFKPNAVA
ncbi:MAG: acylneuraminate cytidylyltransferase family protein, partial [Planctomycetes bacterium]|nr:acylneuraminate cytidylyltransferase family protein [Planctomycetota bacterium]